MRFTETLIALVAMGAFAFPAFGAPVADTDDTEPPVFLDDKLAAEHSTNATIDAVEASGPHAGKPAGCNNLQHLKANGGTHTEQYTPYANDGISLKVRKENGDFENHILQFEYTNRGPDLHPRISYDVSEVNSDTGDFWRKQGSGGFSVTSSSNSCFSKHCTPPINNCAGVFTSPPHGVVHYCGYGADIGLTVCG
ncbi:MAG: hypothetical protein Q9191_000455 [Dirinaria sp. TL-2023a]